MLTKDYARDQRLLDQELASTKPNPNVIAGLRARIKEYRAAIADIGANHVVGAPQPKAAQKPTPPENKLNSFAAIPAKEVADWGEQARKAVDGWAEEKHA